MGISTVTIPEHWLARSTGHQRPRRRVIVGIAALMLVAMGAVGARFVGWDGEQQRQLRRDEAWTILDDPTQPTERQRSSALALFEDARNLALHCRLRLQNANLSKGDQSYYSSLLKALGSICDEQVAVPAHLNKKKR